MQKIITIPHPTLRKKADLVTKVDKKLIKFVLSLEETLANKKNPSGVGLAAPQIDKLWRIFSINIKGMKTFINPRIIKKSKQITFGPDKEDPILEGCLSIPELYGAVPRNLWIEAEYQFIDNGKLLEAKTKLENFEARVFQHEADHLNGILFTDYSLEYDLPVYREHKKGKYEEVDPSLLELF